MPKIIVYHKKISSDKNLKELDVRANDFLLIINHEDDALTVISATKLRRLRVYSGSSHKNWVNFSSLWRLMKLRSNDLKIYTKAKTREHFVNAFQIDGAEKMKIGKLIMKNKDYKSNQYLNSLK